MKIYCLTLPEKPERKARALAHFTERGLNQNHDVHFVDGIYGETSGVRTAFTYDVDNPGTNFNMGPHCVGIWLSHWTVWQLVLHGNEGYAMVFEDDAILPEDFDVQLNNILSMSMSRGWDFLFLGSCCAAGKGGTHIAGPIWEIKYPMCFHAYVVTRAGARKLIETQRKIYAPIDISAPFHSFPSMKVYTVQPSMVQQHNTVIPP